MVELGGGWAAGIGGGAVVFLDGDLGAGKTTLARGILRGLGYRGAVTSPTYTLVERYDAGARTVYHFDLYRLEGPAELEATGLRDWLDGEAIILIEWPERGGDALPAPDIRVDIRYGDGDCARRVWVDCDLPGPGGVAAGTENTVTETVTVAAKTTVAGAGAANAENVADAETTVTAGNTVAKTVTVATGNTVTKTVTVAAETTVAEPATVAAETTVTKTPTTPHP